MKFCCSFKNGGLWMCLLFVACESEPQSTSQVWEFDSSIRAIEVTEKHGVWWAGANGLV